MKNITCVVITQYNSNRQIENQVDVTSIAKQVTRCFVLSSLTRLNMVYECGRQFNY